MTMATFALISTFAALAAALAGAWFFVRVRELEAQLEKAKDSVTQTSRLLIEKNVELVDQNVVQQKELSKKDDFLAIASHQLRTPLNEVIWGVGEMIDAAHDPEEKAQYERIFSSARRMQKIIEDLLGFVHVDQGRARLAVLAYQPDPIVLAAAQRLEADFKGRGVTLELHLAHGRMIESIDPESLDMIVSNFIENAYRYTPAPGRIDVYTKRGADDSFEFQITDTGIGVSAEMQQTLFTKFRRSPRAVELNKEGSGLGLYIIKTLLDLAGGAVSFESTEGKGSTFRFHVPKALAPEAAKRPDPLSQSAALQTQPR